MKFNKTRTNNKIKSAKKSAGNKAPAQVIRFEPRSDYGLSQRQVEDRKREGLVNAVTDKTSKSTSKIILTNVFTYFNIIFFLLAAVLLCVRSYNNLTFMGVVCANTVIGIVQEIRSKKTLDKLKLVSSPMITVIRDGRDMKVPGDELVLDDIVIFEAGSQICADAVVCAGEAAVNESLVTGEADEVKKSAGDTLLSGSFVVSGRVKARLERVGNSSFAAQLTRDAKQIKKKQQPGMMRSLTLLIQVIGIIIIPFAALMFYNQYSVLGYSARVSVENTSAAIIGMIPEGLYLLTSIALAASTIRLAKNKTLVHDMKCIETLARVDVLCVDKTGTITEPRMSVSELIELEGEREETKKQLGDFVGNITSGNETIKAIQKYLKDSPARRRAVRVKNFSSATKYSAVDFGLYGKFILGAPEFLLNGDLYGEVLSLCEKHSSCGERVLLFASYEFDDDGDIFAGGRLTGTVTPLALITLTNPIRPHARETFDYFREQGVEIKVISGDNPITASTAAKEAGIENAEKYIDVSSLKSSDDIIKAASEYTVFGRVTPQEKRLLIRAMKKAGHTVAMTGDGVNDVPAMKDADCSIAMASGTEAAANVSDLVLLDSDFSGMPHVVAEGRRVINNIERSATLFLVKNIFSFVLSLISILSMSLYPLKPAQVSLVSSLMIGIPSFFLALEPNHDMVHGKFLRNVMFRAFPAGLTAVVLVVWSMLFADAFGIATEASSTVALYLFAFSAYVMLFHVCRPVRSWRGGMFALLGVLFVLCAALLPGWFNIVPLDYGCALILSVLLCLTVPLDYAMRYLFTLSEKLTKKLYAKIKAIRTVRRPLSEDDDLRR